MLLNINICLVTLYHHFQRFWLLFCDFNVFCGWILFLFTHLITFTEWDDLIALIFLDINYMNLFLKEFQIILTLHGNLGYILASCNRTRTSLSC